MSEHTSGPWSVGEDNLVWKNELKIADCSPRGFAHVAPKSERLPNANLIAAAPDLLDALLGLSRWETADCWCDQAGRDGVDKRHSWPCQDARDAIAKARGGQ